MIFFYKKFITTFMLCHLCGVYYPINKTTSCIKKWNLVMDESSHGPP